MSRRRRKRPDAIWLRNSAGGWNVGIRGERPSGPIIVTARDGTTSTQELGERVGERVFHEKTYTLYAPFSSAHPHRTQHVHLVRANQLGWFNALSPHF